MSIIYTEEFMINFLDNLLVSLYKAVLNKEDKILSKNIPMVLKYLGRYCYPNSYTTLVMSAIKNELASFYTYTQAGSIKAFGYLFTGSAEFANQSSHFDRLENMMGEFVFSIKSVVQDSLDLEISEILVQTIIEILDCLLSK